MKKIAVVVIFIATTAFLFIYFTNRSYTKERVLAKYSLSKKELSLLKDGDIVLRYGYGMVSDLIVKNLKEPYTISHCGIVCKRKDSTIVIHSVSSSVSNFDGLQYQSIKSFIYDSKRNSLIVIRYKKQNPNDSISLISKGAYYYLNKKVPFDHAFNLEDSTEIYCSELVWLIIKNNYNDDFLKDKINKKMDHFRFDAFMDTSRFEVIINHQEKKN